MSTTGTKALSALTVVAIAGLGLVGCSAAQETAKPQPSASQAPRTTSQEPAPDAEYFVAKGEGSERLIEIAPEGATKLEYKCKDGHIASFGWMLGSKSGDVDESELTRSADGTVVYEGVTYAKSHADRRTCS